MRLSKSLCAVVGRVLSRNSSHATLDALFISAGVPGEPPNLPHYSKWKEWLFRVGQDPNIDSLVILGALLEEFMDLPPKQGTSDFNTWKENREAIEAVLGENGLRYYRFGRILPQDDFPPSLISPENNPKLVFPTKPSKIEELLEIIVCGLRRAMHPLTHRRKGVQSLTFGNEYDVQDLLHAMLRPWIKDIRPEEFTPSYAGSSTRMDFLLPAYALVIETKIIRDKAHSKRIGDELIIDIEHYRQHQGCQKLWCAIYDPDNLITNPSGLKADLEGLHKLKDGEVLVTVFIV